MMNSLLLEIDEMEETKYNGLDFLTELKDTLHELDKLPIEEIRLLVKSNEFKEDRDEIERKFWKEFKSISKDDCSLDSAIILQHYGFTLNRKPYKDEIILLEENDNADIDE